MVLQPNDFLNGITCIISVVISYALVIEMIRKSYEHKNKMLMYIGFSTFGLIWVYCATVISFIWQFFTQYPFLPEIYLILGNCIGPFSIPCWIYVVLTLTHTKRVKFYVVLVFILMISLFIIYAYLTFTIPEFIGETLPGSKIDVKFQNFGLFYSMVSIILVYGGLIIFLRDVFKSASTELKIKGIFILIALITFLIVVILDGYFELEPIPLIIVRILLIISSIEGYIGWIMPEYVKKLFPKIWRNKVFQDNFFEISHKEYKHDSETILKLLSTRPKKITEEEVSFFHEKKICLVCKGKVEKYNFICKCDALYCIKCVEALIELENLCWACNEPLDDSKPVKKFKGGDYNNTIDKGKDHFKKN